MTREKEEAGDLGMVTRARKRRMVETSGVRKEVKTSFAFPNTIIKKN